jgi:hypothetical protein
MTQYGIARGFIKIGASFTNVDGTKDESKSQDAGFTEDWENGKLWIFWKRDFGMYTKESVACAWDLTTLQEDINKYFYEKTIEKVK